MNMDMDTDVDTDTDMNMDMDTDVDITFSYFSYSRNPYSAIVAIASFGLLLTHHAASSNSTINL
jgi:hypothetical protein